MISASCPREDGYCVDSKGNDQNSDFIKLDSGENYHLEKEQLSCLRRCLAHKSATGCEVIWKLYQGCYVHTSDVGRGQKTYLGLIFPAKCWVFSKCKGNVVV